MNWAEVKSRYVTGDMSLRQLADQEGLSHGTVLGIASREGWAGERNRYRTEAYETSLSTRRSALVSKLKEYADQELSLIGMAYLALEDTVQSINSPQDIKTFGSALESLQRASRFALGLPVTPADSRSIHEIGDLREASSQTLWSALLSDPTVQRDMLLEGVSPDQMTDSELLAWIGGRVKRA